MAEMIFCRGCGKEIHKTAAACPHCGASQRTRRYKSKTAAGILAIILGGLGVHRFYLGQWWGIFYLLFFWLWIPGLVAFVEGIVFLCTDDEKWDRKYNEGIPSAGEGSGALVVAVIAGIIFVVFIVGVLAAIAIPAYQEYTVKAKVMGAMATGDRVKQRVEKYVRNNRAWPTSNADIAFSEKVNDKAIEAVTVGDGGAITIVFAQTTGAAAGQTLLLTPRVEAGELKWSCDGGTLIEKYRARECKPTR